MKRESLLVDPKPVRLHVPDFTRVNLTLVGCGGTGSHLASALIAISQALEAKGIGMDMLFVDPDIVEPKNVGRQLFAVADVGKPKAQVLAERLNAAYGTKVGASTRAIANGDALVRPGCLNVVCGCVDNAAARSVIANQVKEAHSQLWWADMGNDHHSGQIALGNVCDRDRFKGAVALGMISSLPAPALVYPDLTQAPKVKKPKRAPSCAELTQMGEQGLMVNRAMAAYAASLLADFLVQREVKYFALALDLQFGGTRPYYVDLATLSEVTGLKVDQLVARTKERKR